MQTEEIAAALAEHGRDIANLVGWQKSQNGSIHRVEAKVDSLKTWMMGALLTGTLAAVSSTVSVAIALATKGR